MKNSERRREYEKWRMEFEKADEMLAIRSFTADSPMMRQMLRRKEKALQMMAKYV